MSARHSSSSRRTPKASTRSPSLHSKSKSTRTSTRTSHDSEMSPQDYSASSFGEEEEEDWVVSGDEYSESGTQAESFETRSLTDSIRKHVFEGGRRYHAYHSGKYPFPNDEMEQEREDLKHLLSVTLCNDKYFFAPVQEVLEKGAEVLDLGTGTGIWCTQLADQYPNSAFLGVDLSPIQPEDEVPLNALFMVDDIEDDWDLHTNKFDYIHVRHTLHSIKDRHTLFQRAFKHLKPGGYLEMQEFHFVAHCDDGTLNSESVYRLHDFLHYLKEGLAALGSDMHAIEHAEDDLRAAGFEHIRCKTFNCPIGTWPKKSHLAYCGDLLKNIMLDGLAGLSRKPLGIGLGWTPLQIEMFLIEVRRSVVDTSFHTYFPLHSVYGRKPPEKHGRSDKSSISSKFSGSGSHGGSSGSGSSRKHGQAHNHHKKRK